MSKAKHTPAPWSASETISINEKGAKYLTIDALVNGSGVEGLAVVYEGVFGLDPDAEMRANAQLIAEAPSMYEILKTINKGIHKMEFSQLEGLQNEIEELIKKIEG